MNRDQLRAMHLAGTVAVPQKFPELANVSFTTCPFGGNEVGMRREYLCAEHILTPKLRIRRWFFTRQVRAVFLPRNPSCVDWCQGDWFLAGEVFSALPTAIENRGTAALGILYVPEQAETLMQVEVGMTAAESVEYYPPMPDDRTVDHYRLHKPTEAQQQTQFPSKEHSAPAWDPCSLESWDPCSLESWDPCSFKSWDPYSWAGGEATSENSSLQASRKSQTSARLLDPCSLRLW